MAMTLKEIPEDPNEEEEKVNLTPYQKLLQAVHDSKFSHEVALEKRVGLYKFCGDIGRGNFSRVKKAVHLLTRDKVAIKIVDRSRLDTKNLRMLSREVSTLECVQHPYILRLFEVVETLGKVHLVTELIEGGELYYKIVQNGVYTEAKARKIFKQLSLAIQHMHNLGYVHRDVKAENVLVVSEEHVKLGDFGFSTQVTGNQHFLNTFCGSPPYASPELFLDDHYQGAPVDIWALGVLLYFVLIGGMPFSAPTVPQLRSTILKGEYQIPGHFTPSCIKLIQCILIHNPKQRPSIDTILNCTWLHNKRLKKTLSTESRSSVGRRKKTSFWCSRTSKTSPLSASTSPISLRPVEPIECYTKKYNNVPMEKFKNPLENTTIPNRNNTNHNQSASRNNSQRNTTTTHKNGGNHNVEIVQKNDIIQVRTYAQENNNVNNGNGEDVSISSESRDFEKFMMIPTQTNGDVSSLHPMEIETRRMMENYGINRETLEKNAENGPRSEVIGIYRILIMRLKNMHEREKAKELEANGNDMKPPSKTNSNSKHKSSTKKRIDATKCAIL